MVSKDGMDDVFPQLLSAQVVVPASGAWTTAEITMPIAIGQLTKTKAIVVEILKVFFASSKIQESNITGLIFLLTRNPAAVVAFSDPAVIAGYLQHNELTTEGNPIVQEPYVQDLTDGNGNGVLIAVPRLFLGGDADAGNVAFNADIKILYRVREVNVAEFVGIAQSQIAGN